MRDPYVLDMYFCLLVSSLRFVWWMLEIFRFCIQFVPWILETRLFYIKVLSLVMDSDHHRNSCMASVLDVENPRWFDQAQAFKASEEFRLLLDARFSCFIVSSC